MTRDGSRLFSVVMPAFNAASTIGRAVGSLQAQTCSDWELVVCDDGSTDSTADVVREFSSSDPRIRLISLKSNTGSAYKPRRCAVEAACGEWIVELDSDDTLSPDYLESARKAFCSSGADLLVSRMRAVGPDGGMRCLPAPCVETMPVAGRRLVKHTVDGWDIPLWLVCRKSILMDVYADGPEDASVFADEILSRRVLCRAPLAAFFEGEYRYSPDSTSVTSSVGPARFSFLRSDRCLLYWLKDEFGVGSEEYRMGCRRLFGGICEALLLLRKVVAREERRKCQLIIAEAWNDSAFSEARRYVRGYLGVISYLGPYALKTAIYVRERGKKR